ncbi:MAG: hypothetical protein H7641_14925 [Candidatus Heimdallarchaeota archaeon]|nr:hypothetical protein [Candidatus Heimdallarchaeota archaeon]MCK4878856.1 hypothetical protein [Candidatus Heimdallarchaeota archaeon]
MSDEFDFDKYWLRVFSMCLDDEVGEKIRDEILLGSEKISSKTDREEVFQWTKQALAKLDSFVDEEKKITIMTGCACQYPRANLQDLKKLYAETKDLKLIHQKMQEEFEIFIDEKLMLEDKYKQEVIKRSMGMAGKLEGNKIIATKIPKSAFVKDWFEESDPAKKRAIYCHCPRIREAMDTLDNELPLYHCYCGAGFYKGMWEEILQQPVEVEVLETVMNDGEVCKIAIELPENI